MPNASNRPKQRKIVRWNDDLDKSLLLFMHHVCAEKGIKIPYGKIARAMGPDFTGGAIVQHIQKLRKEMADENVVPVPESPGRRPRTRAAAPSPSPSDMRMTKAMRRSNNTNMNKAVHGNHSRGPSSYVDAYTRSNPDSTNTTDVDQAVTGWRDDVDFTNEWISSQGEVIEFGGTYTNLVAEASGLGFQVAAAQPMPANQQQVVQAQPSPYGFALLPSRSDNDSMGWNVEGDGLY